MGHLGTTIADHHVDSDPLRDVLRGVLLLFFVATLVAGVASLGGCTASQVEAVKTACEKYEAFLGPATRLVEVAEYAVREAEPLLRAQEKILTERMQAAHDAGIFDTPGFQEALEGLRAAVDAAAASFKRLEARAGKARYWFDLVTDGVSSACSFVGAGRQSQRHGTHGTALKEIAAGLAALEAEMAVQPEVGADG